MKDKMYWDWEKSDFIDADIKQELKGVSCSAEMVIELQKLKVLTLMFYSLKLFLLPTKICFGKPILN